MLYLTIYTYKTLWHSWLWEILIIVPKPGPSPLLTFNQSFRCQPMKGAEGWRRTELQDWALWRAERRTERHISPNAHQTFGREDSVLQRRPVREYALIFLDMPSDGETFDDEFWYSLTTLWFPSESSFSTFPHPFSDRARDGASTKRAESSSKTSQPRTHQLRHRPDSGSRFGAGERAHAGQTEWIGFKQRGRLL